MAAPSVCPIELLDDVKPKLRALLSIVFATSDEPTRPRLESTELPLFSVSSMPAEPPTSLESTRRLTPDDTVRMEALTWEAFEPVLAALILSRMALSESVALIEMLLPPTKNEPERPIAAL